MLRILYEDFCAYELAAGSAGDGMHGAAGTGNAAGPRAAGFRKFVAEGGESLRRHALFDALDHHCRQTLGTASGWMSWPEKFHDPTGSAVVEFATTQAHEVEFFLYLQWLAHEQLSSAQALA